MVMDNSQIPTEELLKEKQKRNILKAVQQPQQSVSTEAPITQQEFDAWRGGLNPADYQTALNPQEMQRFTDWAAKTNAPITDDYDMQGYWKNEIAPYAALEGKYTPEQIAGARQGLNSGIPALAGFIKQQGIKSPTTPAEVVAAKQGKFNPVPYDGETQHYTDKYKTPLHETFSNESMYATGDNAKYAGKWDGDKYISPVQQAMVSGLLDKVKGGLTDIGAGFNENSTKGFDMANLQADPTKTGWNRLGEALGTGYRVLSNPALQGLVAGALYGKYKGDAMEGLKYGIDWAQNKQKSDYYANKLGQRPGLLGGFNKDDYNADVLSLYRDTMANNAKMKTEAMLDRESPKMEDYAKSMLAGRLWTEDEYNAFISSSKYNPNERINLQTIKLGIEKAIKEKDIDLKELKTNGQLQYWIDTIGLKRESNDIDRQRVANSKENADKNYRLNKEKFEYEKTHPKTYGGYYGGNSSYDPNDPAGLFK